MKPDDMHAAVEEVDLDPCDLYTDLGILIIEGRVPGLTDKGFGEGPHCPGPHAQNRHQCDPANAECQKYEQILKHMLLLWKNGIPMTIEVLLYPSCCTPSQNVESVPDTSYLLLEQWTIHMLPRRMPDASISSRGLIQAVRSFLYFSQLCAWFSLTGGKSPKNVHYRVCVPGEAFSSKFSSPPDCHIFPVANVGRNAAMKVLMKSHPRCGEIPTLRCHQHSLTHHPLSSLKAKGLWTSDRNQTRAKHEEESAAGEYPFDGVLLPGSTTDRCRHLTGVTAAASSSRTSSPADSMLGESLLDPPNALCMYAKRYQSPSRCGSPSIEVPEHLMFGKREDSPPIPPPIAPPRRSRPQRRPVVERFLKKDEVDPSSTTGCRTFDKRASAAKEIPLMVRDYPNTRPNILTMSEKDEMLNYCCRTFDKRTCAKGLLQKDFFDKRICATKNYPATKPEKDEVLGYCCIEDCMKDVPREEMEQVLERLSERHGGGRPKCHDGHCLSDQKGLHKKSLSQLIDEMKINSNLVEQNNNELKKSVFHKNNDLCDSKSLFKQALRLNKESSSRKFDRNTKSISSYETFSSLPEVPNNNHRMQHKNNFKSDHLEEQTSANQLLANKLNRLESSTYFHSKNDDRLRDASKQNSSEAPSASRPSHQHDSDIHPRLGSVNIKKCGAFLLRDDNAGDLNDEREISPRWLDEEDILPTSFLIPSAEKKALFRRSLDSATSLVFHQRSGLPLTSSPAPVRKSGTCFDFDSSITSVSAIKRALFEKELEEDKTEKENSISLSNSAPASIVSSSLLGTFEESVLNGRLEPVSTVEGFTAEIGASGSFCPRHITLPVTVFFYTLQDMDKVTSPYMGHINLRDKDYHIPKRGTVQVTLFNPHGTVVKMFVVRYDLSDMPVNCQTFLRQRTLYMPPDACPENDPEAQKWLRYLIHLRFMSSKSGRIYLHTDIRVIIFRKSDLDAATVHGQRPYELRSFIHGPLNPKFSLHNKP